LNISSTMMDETCFPRPSLTAGILQKHGLIPQKERPRAKDSGRSLLEKERSSHARPRLASAPAPNPKSTSGAKAGEAKHLKFAAASSAKLVPTIGSGESLQAVGKH
jgi:hypothetical protein